MADVVSVAFICGKFFFGDFHDYISPLINIDTNFDLFFN